MAARQRLALRPHVPVAPQPADLEGLRPAHRRLDATTTSRPRPCPAIRSTLQLKGKPVAEHAGEPQPRRPRLHRQHHAAARGRRRRPTSGPDGKKIKVAPLTDEDRLTLVRWIDLGCPIDLDYDPARPGGRRLRLDARRPAADADADLPARRRQPAADAHPGRHARLRRAGRWTASRSSRLPGRRCAPRGRTWRAASAPSRGASGS